MPQAARHLLCTLGADVRVDNAKVAASIAVAFVAYALSGAFEAAMSGISVEVIRAIWLRPQAISTTFVCLTVAVGLWRHFNLAWWLGAISATIQLIFIAQLWTLSPAIAAENVLSQALVLGFIAVLAHPNTRRLCVRKICT